jgi:hypothetical protein
VRVKYLDKTGKNGESTVNYTWRRSESKSALSNRRSRRNAKAYSVCGRATKVLTMH